MAKHFIKQNDDARSVQALLKIDGLPIDLTTATVLFKMRNVAGGTPLIAAAAVIGDPTLGKVQYTFQPLDTVNPGSYYIEWQVTFPDTSVLTVPDNTYDLLDIVPNLG